MIKNKQHRYMFFLLVTSTISTSTHSLLSIAASNPLNKLIVDSKIAPAPYYPEQQPNKTINNFSYDAWPDAFKPNNVWWIPLEFSVTDTDVIEAIVTPVSSPSNPRGYELNVGNNRKNINNDELILAQAVGKLVYKPKFGQQWSCSATHVGNGYIVTAGHCVADPMFNSEACSALTIEWDYRKSRKDMSAPVESNFIGKCQQILSWQFTAGDPTTIDHAIIKVDQAPEAKIDIDPRPTLKTGDKIHQLSHPGGYPLIWSENCDITDKLFQYYKHNCWGASGSSGSALIDINTKKLVGVLSMGLEDTNFSVRNDSSPIGCFNVNTGEITPNCNN